MSYAELQVTSHFSFLRGASSAEELFMQAAQLGIPALGIVDRGSVAGIVRAWEASKKTGVRLIVGTRLDLVNGTSLLVYPTDRAAYSRLMRLLTRGKGRAGKGGCLLHFDDLTEWSEGLIAILLTDWADARLAADLDRLKRLFGNRVYCGLVRRFAPDDHARLDGIVAAARTARVPIVATGDVLYHAPERRILQDVVTCIRLKCTIDGAGFRRERHADRFLKPPDETARLFTRYPEAIAHTGEIAARCRFDLSELKYQYPHEVIEEGFTAQETLERLTWAGVPARYPNGLPDRVAVQIRHELSLIEELGYAPYFLTVNSIVRFARNLDPPILCQGRGSAANSAVCFVLGVTSIDPIAQELLFERFLSNERREPPDIDVDFEHERREEVIQWIYETYGRDRSALTATVIRYGARGAVREVGKVLGLPEDVTGALARLVWGWSREGVGEGEAKSLNLNTADRRLRMTLDLARELIGTPRHLSQHPGGFVLTEERLDDLVPIEPAAMVDRQVIEWDKDDIDALGFMKVDVLGLGMLGCMRRAFDLLKQHRPDEPADLATIPPDEDLTYAMIRKADTMGTFQIESRAQMAMLPRMKPVRLYDLVIQVAIVRPGPIQGDMVHPYLRRREGREVADYPKPELKRVLEKTLGIPLFQEQAMRVAIECAGFTPGEADQLRRAMATFKLTGQVSKFRDKLVGGMTNNGYTLDFAERTFKQLEGFGSYGFPESHAASFALIAYASSWVKCHHPDIFLAAILNAQPMGFYASAQLVRDAIDHGVEVLPPDVNFSSWDCTLEEVPPVFDESRRSPTRALFHGERSSRQAGDRVRGVPLPDWARPSPCPSPNGRGGPRWAGSANTPTKDPRAGYPFKPVRLGLRLAKGLSNKHGAAIVLSRADAPYESIEDLWRRAGVPVAALTKLAEADAFGSLDLNRRDALWAIKGLRDEPLPLFAAADHREGRLAPEFIETPVRLTPMSPPQEVVEDYRSTGVSLRQHPLAFLRADLARRRMVTCKAVRTLGNGRRISLAGLVLVRQKPGSAKGVMFITLEDETDIANLVIWPSLFARQRRLILQTGMMGVRGRVQREGEVIHVVAEQLEDLSGMLRELGRHDGEGEGGPLGAEADFPFATGRGDEARHGGSPDQRDEPLGRKARDIFVPDLRLGSGIKIPTRDFR